MKLRPYQEAAVKAVYDHLRNRDDNPCVVMPTGSGKTIPIATICKDAVTLWGGRVLILAHVKELLQQAADKLHRIAPEVDFGVYSAGLNSRDTKEPVIIAGIQSVYERACELGRFDLILVDESHLIPENGDGRYRTFIKDAKIVNPDVRIVGFTATPFRMSGGMICKPENILNHICYEIGVRELIRDGFLCPIYTRIPERTIDCSQIHVRNGEFRAEEVSALFSTEEAVHSFFIDIFKNTKDRNSILIFCCDVEQAKLIQRELARFSEESVGLITGETPSNERAELISRFKNDGVGLFGDVRPLRWLVNVNVLTTGFDAPNVDCIVLLRPTLSPGLFYQMTGRSFRLHESKEDALVLDYGSNIDRHGPVDALVVTPKTNGNGKAPVRKCPECRFVWPARVSRCAKCGFIFPLPEKESKLNDTASEAGILSGQKTETEYDVLDVYYSIHFKKNYVDGDPRTLKIEYLVGVNHYVTKWVCPEHKEWAWERKFVPWWKQHTDIKPPINADEALFYARRGFLAKPRRIKVIETAGQHFPEVVEYDFEEKPTPPDDLNYELESKPRTCDDCVQFFYGECMVEQGTALFGNEPACDHFVQKDPDVPF